MTLGILPILSLARAGATSRAWDSFVAAGLDRADEIAALTLKGRLLKDRARQAVGARRARLFAEAGAAYERASAIRPDSYPLINAAAMALFAGDRVRCELIASKTLDLIAIDPLQGETPYWREATRAEALLLLGRNAEAKASLAGAVAFAQQAWEDHASTLRQFALILAEMRGPDDWLDPLRPAASLHYSGIMGIDAGDAEAVEAINRAVADIAPGFGYGALAAGADIIAAEAVLKARAELHVVLPSAIAAFKASSVDPSGANWSARFDRLIEASSSLTICTGDRDTSRAGVALAEYQAMGGAAHNATLLESNAAALRIVPASRASIGDPWLRSGRPIVHVPVEANEAIIGPALAEGDLQFTLAMDEQEVVHLSTLAEAADLLMSAPSITAAMDCSTDGRSCAKPLLQAAPKDTLFASCNAAMALHAEGRCARIEPMGAMAMPDGEVEVYAVTLRPSPGGPRG
jgi:hypothetical protein